MGVHSRQSAHIFEALDDPRSPTFGEKTIVALIFLAILACDMGDDKLLIIR